MRACVAMQAMHIHEVSSSARGSSIGSIVPRSNSLWQLQACIENAEFADGLKAGRLR